MSKELEALDEFLKDYLFLCEKLHTNMQEKMLLDGNSPYNVLKTYLESIDNAEPSEALKELEQMREFGNHFWVADKVNKSYMTIKEALLKQQEQENKKYLKWEDLEFKEEKQTILVLLNGEKYILNYHKTINKTFCYDRCFAQLIKLEVVGSSILIGNSDFFNDLHLERVEE